ncbi:hypothetical protein BH23PLA1_BH23PLA1_08650 [soil metagenome]
MEDEKRPPRADWPSWNWRESGWWLTAVGFIIAVVLLVFPGITTLELRVRLGLALLALLMVPLALLALFHLFKALPVALARLRQYDILYPQIEELEKERNVLRSSIIDLWEHLTSGQKLNIKKILYHRETVYLLLEKKRGKRIEVGTTLRAIDIQDGYFMAVLKIIEVRGEGYLAEASSVNPLWLGQIHRLNLPESSPPPRIAAFLLPKQDEGNA